MASENETVADIVADIRAQNQGLPEDSYALSPLVCDLLSFANRIEAAHQREVGELCGERNGILNANASLAADNDRLRKEVAELRECLNETMADAVAEYKNNSCFRNVKCGEIERCDTCKVTKWSKALKGSSND